MITGRSGRFELGTDGPLLLVAALDGSPASMRATAYALGLCRRQGARLVVVHVRHTPAAATLVPLAAGAVGQLIAEIEQELRDHVKAMTDHDEVAVTFVVRRGEPFTEIRRLCDELHADGVLVGVASGAGHRLIGSLAMRLMRTGHWPVTVVP